MPVTDRDRNTGQAEALGDASPVIARLESIAAWAINPSSNARHAMLAAAARPGIAVLAGHGSPVQAIAFSPGRRLLAVIDNDHSLRLWDVATRQPVGVPLTGHTGLVDSVAFSPDGKALAVGGSDGAVHRRPAPAPGAGRGHYAAGRVTWPSSAADEALRAPARR